MFDCELRQGKNIVWVVEGYDKIDKIIPALQLPPRAIRSPDRKSRKPSSPFIDCWLIIHRRPKCRLERQHPWPIMSILSNRFDSGTGQPRSEQVQLRW